MASIIKVDQIQSDTGVMNLSSGLVYIDQNNRRVGIGNTSPSQILEITDTAPRVNFISTNNDSGARYNTDGTATNSHRWQYQGVTQMGLTSGGTLDLPYGQLKFPATQNASSDPNTLDDYEEGTWTPTLFGQSSAGTTSYAVQRGGYIKVGSMVTVFIDLGVSSATGTGATVIGNLPFTSINDVNFNSCAPVMVENLNWGGGTYMQAYKNVNSTNIFLYYMADDASWVAQQMTNEAQNYIITMTYRAA